MLVYQNDVWKTSPIHPHTTPNTLTTHIPPPATHSAQVPAPVGGGRSVEIFDGGGASVQLTSDMQQVRTSSLLKMETIWCGLILVIHWAAIQVATLLLILIIPKPTMNHAQARSLDSVLKMINRCIVAAWSQF